MNADEIESGQVRQGDGHEEEKDESEEEEEDAGDVEDTGHD